MDDYDNRVVPLGDVERSVRFATVVDDLNAAWVEVMNLIEDPMIGIAPTIHIRPEWHLDHPRDSAGGRENLRFSVVVEGWQVVKRGQET